MNYFKFKTFKEFLKILSKHKLGECMDIVPMNVDYKIIEIPNQKK